MSGDKFIQANIDISELAELRSRLAEVERERDRANYFIDNMGDLFVGKPEADALREQLTQAREALERIRDADYRGNRSPESDIARQALATINREGTE